MQKLCNINNEWMIQKIQDDSRQEQMNAKEKEYFTILIQKKLKKD